MMKELQKKQFYIQSQPWEINLNQSPEIFILVTPAMKEQYSLFGDVVCFDTTYNLVKEIQAGSKWKLGLLIGVNHSFKIIPFGLCLVLHETKEAFYKIFRSFFEILNRSPSVIITDESSSIKSALEQLKNDRQFQGLHLLDRFHILKNVKKGLKQKSYLEYFSQLISVRFPLEFQRMKQKAAEEIYGEQDLSLLTKFVDNAYRYCFSKIETKFVGFSISNSISEKANDLLKSWIPIEKSFTQVVLKTFSFLENLIQKSSQTSFQKRVSSEYYLYPELRLLRVLLCSKVFKQLVKQSKEAILLVIEREGCSKFIVKGLQGSQFQINKNFDSQNWQCSCSYQQKTGIPCSHVIKVPVLLQTPVESYISPRWKIAHKIPCAEPKERKKRGRITRRNKLY